MKKKRKIAVFSSSRADFGQLKNLMFLLKKDKDVEFHLVVIGSHFDKKRGYSIKEIVRSNIKISKKLKIELRKFSPNAISNYTSETIKGVSKIISVLKPHIILLLGDRYETFAVATASLIHNIPLAHLRRGEVTAGVIDEPQDILLQKCQIYILLLINCSNLDKKKIENKKYLQCWFFNS